MTALPSKLPWTATMDGADLVVRNITATSFGGAYDAGDDGQTESGDENDGKETVRLLQVSLPIRSTESATANSPLAFKGPHIPWNTVVMVWREADGESTAVACVLSDNGPDVKLYPEHALDCNPNVVLHFEPGLDPKKVANTWMRKGFSYRIVGGAKYIS